MTLTILPGTHPNTHTIGYWMRGRPYRDRRFSPVLTLFEARWLLAYEQKMRARFREWD